MNTHTILTELLNQTRCNTILEKKIMNQKDLLVHLSRQQELIRDAEMQRQATEAAASMPLHSVILGQLGRALVASGEYLLELHDESVTTAQVTHKTANQ